jgi:hypothetical protein
MVFVVHYQLRGDTKMAEKKKNTRKTATITFCLSKKLIARIEERFEALQRKLDLVSKGTRLNRSAEIARWLEKGMK